MAKIAGYISPSAFNRAPVALIVFFASTGLGLHWWPDSAFVYGVRVDYLSPTLYFLDILIIFYLTLNLKLRNLRYPIIHNSLFIILLVNLLFSANPLSTLTWSLRLVLYIMFIFIVPQPIIHNSLFRVLPIALLFQVVLGAAQVVFGRALQGPFYWLGERALNVGSPNVAKWSLFGNMTLRAYGTFSHPNILAGWLLVSLLIVLYLKHSHKPRTVNHKLLACVVSLGLFLTNGRAAIFSFLALIVPFQFFNSLRSRIIYFFALLLPLFILPVIHSSYFSPLRSPLSLTERINLIAASQKILTHSPLFGSGANASISLYPELVPTPRLLQPDHNSFSLFLSWFGAIGTVVIIYILWSTIIHNSYPLIHLIPLLPLLLLDHYFLTSIQGLFIFLLYLRVISELSGQDAPFRNFARDQDRQLD